ncbi:MAG: M56 family metallopeptidase, partial [Candidatus Solibacter sp.]|nr:M56 family metallopeptidase [Candidatus Solibacter sp.]
DWGIGVPSARAYALALYLAGLLLVAGRFVAGAVRTARMVRQARPAGYAQAMVDRGRRGLGIGRPVRALESPGAAVPMTWGTLRPVVLLPEAARHWPSERLHAVVLHELIHVRRQDLPAQVAAQAACCLYWFHPLVWLAAKQLRKERERACDDAVLSGGVPAPDYAGHLLELARVLVERRSLADAPAMAETGDLEERVRAVLDGGRNRAPLNRRLAATVAMLACAFMLPVALVSLHAQAASGALVGIVQDASQARVPFCAVRVKNLDGKNEEVAKVNAAGEFVFASIPVGRYAIEVRARGFAVGKREVLVEAGRRAEALVTLPLGQISEAVTVTGSRPATGSLAPPASVAVAKRMPQRIPVGGNVQPVKLLQQTRPVYPAELKQQGITGTVMLRAVISITGELLNPEVINTTVHPGLAQAALDAVRQWRYQPALLNGQPVEVSTTIDVTFELEQ